VSGRRQSEWLDASGHPADGRRAVYDCLVYYWLDNTEDGRRLAGKIGRDIARQEIQALAAAGLVRIITGTPDRSGRFSLRIEAAVPPPANDAAPPEIPPMNRQQRRAAARRAAS